ncbi:aromatic acid exporter family protein [Aquibacillus rhizosphaerae]|uniref:Aromatic acid exporter family protein n=1 Tax=Aquibacillus rhizosphaerae TaxID=3051431 RepID=A0ABT7L053_9BACI|nr:aromatic acid exporter family protein [Aquibacillus sp. LR5S19]MDL4839199.1 aromatic acid exporter family protein [Aquibacillus sp. LR5S19]
MIKKLRFKFIGSRIVKTGLAVFLTSLICQALDWPAVFAVITAIVTIEPTVSDSIKKGIVRFPASAIGSAYAVLFIFLFGNSPITYTGAALFTIITCFKLRLHAGLLVATLTSVAMIEVIHGNFLFSFFIRLGTTTIGLIISTLVNMFVLPPNYSKRILTNIDRLLQTTGEELEVITHHLFQNKDNGQNNPLVIKQTFTRLKKELDHNDMLVRFQKEEAKYHKLDNATKKLFEDEQDKLSSLRLIHYHIGNLINTPLDTVNWSKQESDQLIDAVDALVDAMKYPDHFSLKNHQQQVHGLMEHFWRSKKSEGKRQESNSTTFFSAEIIILYELLSIFNLVEAIINDS